MHLRVLLVGAGFKPAPTRKRGRNRRSHESCRRDRRDSQARRRGVPELLSDQHADRSRGGGRHQAHRLPPGAGRSRHRRRLHSGDERQTHRRLHHAGGPRRRERFCRHHDGVLRLGAGSLASRRPRPRHLPGFSFLPLRPILRSGNEVGRGDHPRQAKCRTSCGAHSAI